MPEGSITIDVQPLNMKLKSTFRHAGATRRVGDSLWIRARRGDLSGYGEGCPRPYAAGDDTAESIRWVRQHFSQGALACQSFEDLAGWVATHADLIDRYPSAWCAVEMALLDLFSKERGCSVEALLGMGAVRRRGRYSAVLGDDERGKFVAFADQYLVRGFSDFKLKLNGDLERDREKIVLLRDLCARHGVSRPRIRVDANNLWRGRADEAGRHLASLGATLFAVEEPVGAGDTAGISQVSQALGVPVVLDESLCTLKDLARFKGLPGRYFANIKVSRVGGILRALKFIEALKDLGWPIIIGCHVGETSLLTRAALVPAAAAGENLIAQEGAYGDYLVEREPVEPTLKFGHRGQLDLDAPYLFKSARGLQTVPVENWDTGFGLKCRWPALPDDGSPERSSLEMPGR